MRSSVVCCVLLGLALCAEETFRGKDHVDNTEKQFEAVYVKYHGQEGLERLLKRASSEEMEERMEGFRNAVETVEDINDNKNTRFSAAANEISVMTKEEKEDMLNLNPMNVTAEDRMRRRSVRTRRQVPDSVNWVSRGAQTDVKNQGSCGSCWAFAAVSALEGNYYIMTGDLIAFSEQEYVDCVMEHYYNKHRSSWSRTHSGCSGAWMDWAFDYSVDAGRMASMSDFSYVGSDRTCNMEGVEDAMTKVRVTGTEFVDGDDETLAQATSEGIVSVAILVVDDFSYYRTGIFDCLASAGCDCSNSINHAVTVVGYTSDYWNVRNSWGSNWGDGGYIKMSRDQDNICNINLYAQRPMLECKGGQTCAGWEDSWDGDDQEEEDDSDFDVGDDDECGELVHFGELCVDMDDTAAMNAVLTSMCDRSFCLTKTGYIRDQATDLCLTVNNTEEDNGAVKFAACSSAETWDATDRGFQADSGKCWRPRGDLNNPEEGTELVINDGSCDEDLASFEFSTEMCWEEVSSSKLSKKLNGEKIKKKKLNGAKNKCLENSDCEGLYLTGGRYYLSGSDNVKDSSKPGDKVWIMMACEDACDAGTQLCDDGECKEQCTDDDDDCPSGTTRCSDGVCKHEHMC